MLYVTQWRQIFDFEFHFQLVIKSKALYFQWATKFANTGKIYNCYIKYKTEAVFLVNMYSIVTVGIASNKTTTNFLTSDFLRPIFCSELLLFFHDVSTTILLFLFFISWFLKEENESASDIHIYSNIFSSSVINLNKWSILSILCRLPEAPRWFLQMECDFDLFLFYLKKCRFLVTLFCNLCQINQNHTAYLSVTFFIFAHNVS